MRQLSRASNAEAMLKELRCGSRAQSQFVPGDMVGVRVGDEADFLPARDVEREPRPGEKHTPIPMKHGCIVASTFTRHRKM
jgi:hypothetical protein